MENERGAVLLPDAIETIFLFFTTLALIFPSPVRSPLVNRFPGIRIPDINILTIRIGKLYFQFTGSKKHF